MSRRMHHSLFRVLWADAHGGVHIGIVCLQAIDGDSEYPALLAVERDLPQLPRCQEREHCEL